MTISMQAMIPARISAVGQLGAIRVLVKATTWFFDPYRPELHYMRGPGPKWREKNLGKGLI